MNTALLIIDVQKSLVEEGIWNAERIIVRLNRLISLARNKQAPVVFIKDTRVGPDGSLHPLLDYERNDLEIKKNFCDAFMKTQLDNLLRNNNINKLVIGGLQSDFCVDTTCRQAATLGYDVLLVADAHSTLDHEFLKAKQIIAHHNRILRNFNSSSGRVRVIDTANINFR